MTWSLTCNFWHFELNLLVDCKRGHHAVFRSTDSSYLTECVPCEVDTYQPTDSRDKTCLSCPEGTTTDGQTGSWECGMLSKICRQI